MSMNSSPENSEQGQWLSGVGYGAYGATNQQYNNSYISAPPLSPVLPSRPSSSGQQAAHTLRIILLLFAIIFLGSLGAIPLAPNFLPASFVSPSVNNKPAPLQPTPTTPLVGGECTATPQQTKYLFSAKTITTTPSSTWLSTGHTQQDLANAQACAASFAISYETFDANDFRTLETSTPMLSSGAKSRFYGRVPSVHADMHMDPLWRAIIQKQNLKQIAQVQLPAVSDARTINNKFFAWMFVPYHLSLQRNDQILSRDAQLTVLLVYVTPHMSDAGTGWQVSAWQDGDSPFAVLNPV